MNVKRIAGVGIVIAVIAFASILIIPAVFTPPDEQICAMAERYPEVQAFKERFSILQYSCSVSHEGIERHVGYVTQRNGSDFKLILNVRISVFGTRFDLVCAGPPTPHGAIVVTKPATLDDIRTNDCLERS